MYFLVVCIEGWRKWIFGVGFLLENSVSYSKFVVRTDRGGGGGQANVDRQGEEGLKSLLCCIN